VTPRLVATFRDVEYELVRTRGAPAQGEAWVMTPRNGGVPDVDELRDLVVKAAAAKLGLRPEGIEPQPVTGDRATGWVVMRGDGGPKGSSFSAVAGVRAGEAALILFAQYRGDPEAASRELMRWIRGARPAASAERRNP
jgi:hypothetical protein